MTNLFSKKMMAALLLIIIATVFLVQNSSNRQLIAADTLKSTPDYFITNITAKEFDEDGTLKETLTANQALHYNQNSRTLLDEPKIERQDPTGAWHAQGKKGIIEDGSRDILITENGVAVKHYNDSPDITLNADNIHYLDSDQSLTSSGNAILFSVQGKTTADEITTYIDSEKVVMTGSVRGQYETTH